MENVTLDTAIRDCELTTGLKAALNGVKINTVRDFVRIWKETGGLEEEFCKIRNCGHKRYKEAKGFASKLLIEGIMGGYNREWWESYKPNLIRKFAGEVIAWEAQLYRHSLTNLDIGECTTLFAEKITKDLESILQ